MGLIQELSRYLEAKYDPEGLISANNKLAEENAKLKAQCQELQTQKDYMQLGKERALDEIVINQKRIDALLRQLSEKNGGR